MMELIVKMQEKRPLDWTVREFNNLMRRSMEVAGQYWIDEYLELHFTAGAVQRYRYDARTLRTLAIKKRAREVMIRFGPRTGLKVPATKPPLPLVWTRELYDATVGGKRNLTPRATATSNRVKVRVPIRLPHPMRPQNAAELVKLAPLEKRILAQVAMDHLIRQRNALNNVTKTKTFIGGRWSA